MVDFDTRYCELYGLLDKKRSVLASCSQHFFLKNYKLNKGTNVPNRH